jgi:hypothetical protein
MLVSRKLLAVSALSLVATFGAMSSFAQSSNGADYRPMQLNSPANPDVQAGAMQAARPSGTEAIGQSTGAPQMNSKMSSDEVYKGAVEASHASGTEAIGQSTALPMMRSGSQNNTTTNKNVQNGTSNQNGRGGQGG